jgi:hypothetical protein
MQRVYNRRVVKTPKFMNEDEETKWWAGAEGREFLKPQSAAGTTRKRKGSPRVSGLSRASSVRPTRPRSVVSGQEARTGKTAKSSKRGRPRASCARAQIATALTTVRRNEAFTPST